ncbi:hypothetical protein Q4F19_07375 [Sphingomonas sp. BIUV-7]|uniref:Uncharacterized protein n=1 Tax=Sphingomonas natans TaxID=3063330 RepID=A0ABT8Y7B1_9SPHN|nr:hypothetical protein [Sphingomonas sp. BIUV-7]MDO6414198.1 hypothetical protein [Sphingomonas sp. BIUV-7]
MGQLLSDRAGAIAVEPDLHVLCIVYRLLVDGDGNTVSSVAQQSLDGCDENKGVAFERHRISIQQIARKPDLCEIIGHCEEGIVQRRDAGTLRKSRLDSLGIEPGDDVTFLIPAA